MKTTLYIALAALILAGCSNASQNLRFIPDGQIPLTSWEFSKDGESWEKVSIPHSYNAIDGHSESYYRGKATYRTSIDIKDSSKPAFLIFEGAAQAATVYVNGEEACYHKGGYTPFTVPINKLLRKGNNTIEVVCDNTEDVSLIPVSSDFNKNGGLHNPVWLFEPEDIYFCPIKYGPYRLHVTTTAVSEESASAVVEAYIVGKSNVTLNLKDATGKIVLTKVQESVSGEYRQEFTLEKPHLWDGVNDPYLYSVEISAGQDMAKTEVGFRFFELNREEGFFLNGKPYPLRGVSMHQDMDGKASALSYADYEADFEIVRELGCNFLRLAHYPHNDYAFRLCDRMGIIVQTEIPWVNVCGVRADEDYFQNIHSQMKEMIVSLYNHPSIVFWGMWNELADWGNKEEFQGSLDEQKVVDESARLYDYAKSLDPARAVGVTDCTSYGHKYYSELKADYYSENRYYGWYYTYGSFSGLTKDMTGIKEKMGVTNISEYGVGINPFCHTWKDEDIRRYKDDRLHVEEYGNLSHESHVQQIAEMPWLNFTSLWILFDFPVASRTEGFVDSSDGIEFTENPARLYMNDKGIVTRDRKTKKDVFYLYKALWNHSEETVYITGKRLEKRPEGKDFTLTVYSNAPSLKLYENGKLVAEKTSSEELSGVIWKFPGLKMKSGRNSYKVVSPTGHSDTITFRSL